MKATITTTVGKFEFEGTEDWVEKQLERVLKLSAEAHAQATMTEKADKSKKVVSHKPVSSKAAPTSAKMITDLLDGKVEIDSIREFVSTKNPSSHMEMFATLSYWLKEKKSIESVGIDHMWTLHKFLGKKAPKALAQVFRDGKSKKGYFGITDEPGMYSLTSFGEMFVEHDLPSREG